MGRKPLDYNEFVTEEILEQIPLWKAEGRTDEWVCKQIGVSHDTAAIWKNKYPVFYEAFKKGKYILTRNLEASLYQRALGFFVEEEDSIEEWKYNEDTEEMEFVVTKKLKKKKYICSDQALFKALSRLEPETWADNFKLKEHQIKVAEEKLLIEQEKLATSTANKIEEWLNSLSDEKLVEIIERIKKERG